VRTAIELAGENGLEALSMRNLADRLHVTPMSLYNHVANKDEILDSLIEAVFAEIELPDASNWKTAIRTSALSARDALVRHPWATSLWMTRQGGGTSRMRHGNWVLATLRTAGLSDEMIFHAYHILETHLLGSTLQQLNFPYQGEELADMARTFLRDFPMDEYPDMVEHIRQHIEPSARSQTGFEFALDLILDGLERARAGERPLDDAVPEEE
jgi:AcrR family transcriptional regulator